MSISKELYWYATTDVQILLLVILLRALNMPIILYMPIINSITATGKPTMVNIMLKVKTLAIGTVGVLIVAIKIEITTVIIAVVPKLIP